MPRKDASRKRGGNDVDTAGMSQNEKILREIESLYVQENGLEDFGNAVNADIHAPARKITVMLVGNHSAGKSSFVNWYVEEHVMKTGVAIETQGITLITSGQRRESLRGPATVHLHNRFKEVADQFPGLMPNLATEVSTSQARKFPLVNFIDTPGLVDGSFQYPFDVNGAIEWFAEYADIVLVFLDPIGQALVERCMSLVERLDRKFPEKLKFYLSKADSVTREQDRQKVLIQVTQGLSQRINNKNFDLPTIYIPDEERPTRVENCIDQLCKDVESAINQNVQANLHALETDCTELSDKLNAMITDDDGKRARNSQSRNKGLLYLLAAMTMPLILMLIGVNMFKTQLAKVSGLEGLVSAAEVVGVVPDAYRMHITGFVALLGVILFMISKMTWKSEKTLDPKLVKKLKAQRDNVTKHVLARKKELYELYFRNIIKQD